MHREQRQSEVTTKRVRQKLHVSCRYHPSPPCPRSFVPLFDLLPLGTFIIWDLTKRTAAFQLTRGLARTKDKQIQRYRCRRLQIQSGEHIYIYVCLCVYVEHSLLKLAGPFLISSCTHLICITHAAAAAGHAPLLCFFRSTLFSAFLLKCSFCLSSRLHWQLNLSRIAWSLEEINVQDF